MDAGVSCPSLITTRLTANNLADHAWVSRPCKARTLPGLPSLAWAIRSCSRFTSRPTCVQSIVDQVPGGA